MDTLHFEQVIVTPSGTPLGGRVSVDVHDSGDYHVHVEMHSSSILAPFDYAVRAYLTAPGFHTLAFVHSGHVDADDSDTYDEDGHSPLLPLYWAKLKAEPHFAAVKDYKWSGAIGTLADIVDDIVEVFAGTVGAALGVVIGATKEALKLIGATLGPGGTFGVIGGVIVFAIAAASGVGIGGAIIAGAVTAVAICVIADLAISSRPLNDAEMLLARRVFGDTVPLDQIMLTNLRGSSGRGFTAQGVDNKIYINLGTAFHNPLAPGGRTYPYPGQILIHELTHAWQISHNNFLPGLMCSMLVTQAEFSLGDDVYAYGPPGPDWSSGFNPEQQAAVVDQWFGGNGSSLGYRPMDQQNIYYRYVWEDVLNRASPPTAPANLRVSAASVLAAAAGQEAAPTLPGEIDVFWTTGDASLVGRHWTDGTGWAGEAPSAFSAAGLAEGGSSLAAVTRAPGLVDVFCVGPDAAVLDQGSSASPPPAKIAAAAAARAGSAVAAVARLPQQLDVFWIGPDGAIISQFWNSDPLQDWDTHGSFAVTAPGAAQSGSGLAAVARVPQHLDVFWVGTDGAIWTMWWDGAAPGGAWASHSPFPITSPGAARFTSPVSCVARTPEHLDVFWIAPDGSVATQFWDAAAGQGWADHQAFPVTGPGAAQPGSGLAAVAREQLQLDVFWTGPDGAVMAQFWAAAPHLGWADHAPFPITKPGSAHGSAPVSAVSRNPDRLDVFWAGTDGAIWTTWWDGTAPDGAWDQHLPAAISPAGAVGYDFAAASTAAQGLLAESVQDAIGGKTGDAVDANRRAVSILDHANVAPDQQLDYLLMLAETRHDLAFRLVEDHQAAQAGALEPAAVTAYRGYAAMPGADVLRVAGDLVQLAKKLAGAGQAAAALDVTQALVDVLQGFTPAAADQLTYLIMLAEARHDLVARLIDDQQVAQAEAAADQAISAYRTYAALPGADVARLRTDLGQLAGQLQGIGDTADAAEAQQAANDLAAPH